MSESEQNTQQQVLRYEYVLGALSDIGDELCRVTSFDAQLKSLLHREPSRPIFVFTRFNI